MQKDNNQSAVQENTKIKKPVKTVEKAINYSREIKKLEKKIEEKETQLVRTSSPSF